ncbi:AsmA family protein [Georhizobium profundi]|uniref:AsmA family protein n=1 Tax=Georhizobium profundi TaxID=2341112 RepID=A0A3Q8XNF3_9HYPH|nr:AsmA family protein [Georhizobium profundi]
MEVGGSAGEGVPAEDAMMRIARFSMDAELAPFLSGEVRIFDMRIEDPHLTVQLDENGVIDWAQRTEQALPTANVVLERVAITNGHLTVQDGQNGRVHEIEDVQATVSADALIGPWRVTGTARRGDESAAFSITTGPVNDQGTIRVTTRLSPDRHPISLELDGDARFVDGQPRYAGNFVVQMLRAQAEPGASQTVRAGPAAAALRGSGRFEAESDRLRIPDYRLEVGAATDPYVVTGEATLDTGPEPEFLVIADGQQIDVDRIGDAGSAPGDEAATDGQATEAEIDEPVVALSAAERVATFRDIIAQIPIPDLPGSVSLNLPAVVAGETTLRDVSIEAAPDNGEAWRVDRFRASLPGRTLIEASGDLALGEDFGFSGDLVVASSQPSGLASWLRGSVPPAIRGLTAAGFQADVQLTTGYQRFENLELAIGPATLQGRFERVTQSEVPSLAVDLSGDTLDLDALSALVGLFGDGDSQPGIAGHDLAARFRAENFTADGIAMSDVDTAFTYGSGLLDIERLSVGDIEGAAISAVGVFSDLRIEPQGRADIRISSENPAAALALAERRLRGVIDLSHFRQNAALFRETDLTVELTLGSARDAPRQNGSSGYSLDIEGTSGGSTIAASVSSDVSTVGADVPLDLTFEAEHPRSDHLLAQIGLPVLPFDVGGPMRIDGTVDGVLSNSASVAATLASPGLSLRVDGATSFAQSRLSAGELDVVLAAEDLDPYLLLTGLGLPGFGSGLPADLTARVTVENDLWRIERLEGQIADNPLSADLTVSRDEDVRIDGSLDIGLLDLPWLAEALAGAPLRSGSAEAWSDRELLQTAPYPFVLDVAVTADEAELGHAEPAQTLSTRLGYQDGTLMLSQTEGEWLGGRISGDTAFGVADDTGVVRLQAQLVDADIGRIFADTPELANLSGRAGIAIALDGTGKSPQAVVGALSGSATLQLDDLRIGGLDQQAFSAILAGADAQGFIIDEATVADLAAEALDAGAFTSSRLAVPINVAGGVARASSIVMQGEGASLSGDGALDLRTMALNASFDLVFEAGDEAMPGALPAVDVAVRGTLEAPEVSLTAIDLANFLSLRAYERERRRVERVQAAVLEKQRLRREAALLRADIAARATEREERAAAEAERLAREAERQAEEAARRAAEAQAAEDALRDAPPPEVPLPAAPPFQIPPSDVPGEQPALEGWDQPFDEQSFDGQAINPSLPGDVPANGLPSGPAPTPDFQTLPGVDLNAVE